MLPVALQDHLEEVIDEPIQEFRSCHGGDINQALEIKTASARYFLKWNKDAAGMFSAEAKGLALLREADVLPVPVVIAFGDGEGDWPGYLLLEWLERGNPSGQTMTMLGEGLAQLHEQRHSAHGLDHDNFIGSLPQYNHSHRSWAQFYAEQRIRPQMEIARQRGHLPSHRAKGLEKIISTMSNFLPEDVAPSLLHGDLWSGNVLALSDGRPAIIDPAVYYGHAEVEMAFIDLFGRYGDAFWVAYRANRDFDFKGYQERRLLLQLYPYMTHMNIFGGRYGSGVDAILRQYLG